jgi:hypothetical protein
MGRGEKFPPQFGQTPFKTVSAHSAQNVHSYVQIRASLLSGGKSRSQHSQFGRSSSMPIFLSQLVRSAFFAIIKSTPDGVNCVSKGKSLDLISDACKQFIPAFVAMVDMPAAVILYDGNNLKIRFPAKHEIHVLSVEGKANEPFPARSGYPMGMGNQGVEGHLWKNVVVRQRFDQNAKKIFLTIVQNFPASEIFSRREWKRALPKFFNAKVIHGYP